MIIYREEIFGPVLVIFRMEDLDQAIESINSNPHGKGAAVFISSGWRPLSRRVRSQAPRATRPQKNGRDAAATCPRPASHRLLRARRRARARSGVARSPCGPFGRVGRAELRLELRDALTQREHGGFDLLQSEALRDVLRTVPVERGDADQGHALHARPVAGRFQLPHQRRGAGLRAGDTARAIRVAPAARL